MSILRLSFLSQIIRTTIRRSPIAWAHACGINLRPYQREVARAIKDSILNHRGLTFVVILPRQSGKNEVQAHIFSWLLFRYAKEGGRIVSVSPTFKPQTLNNMDRVKSSLDKCVGSRGLWKSSKGYLYSLGKARLQFFSGEPRANVVGATADLLLSVDEAQSISPAKFDKDFDPMTASTNATRVFWGTAWTSNTLLERERRAALQAEKLDGIRRVFFYTGEAVMQILPSYRAHVEAKIARHGRQHPLVKTQYFCEEIDAQTGMFPARRLALMLGDQTAQSEPTPGQLYAMTIDVGGQDEALMNLDGMGNPGRDYVTVDIHEVDLSSLESLQAPIYRCVHRSSSQGVNHVDVFGQLCAQVDAWNVQHIVIDSTGVGEGLWGMLVRKYPTRVIPIKFTQQTKSEIGYAFLTLIETGRFRDCARTPEIEMQYEKCQSEILVGPAKTMRWGVKDGTRGADGLLVHDDFLLADALITALDKLEWSISIGTTILEFPDPDIEMRRNF
jgi:hypothetical protein